MFLRARSAKTERKTENKTEYLCPLQRSVLPDVLKLVGKTDRRGISPLKGRYLHTDQHKQNKRTQTSMH
jgi:hypothetical protein